MPPRSPNNTHKSINQRTTMSKVNLRPLDDRVLPDSAKEKPQRGTVVAVGGGKLDKDGKRHNMSVKTGDTVLFGKWAGSDVKVAGEDYKIMRETELLAKVEG
jgi:chaperonin GroES